MTTENSVPKLIMADIEKKVPASSVDAESGHGQVSAYIDAAAEKSCVRKLDFVLLPFLSLVNLFIRDIVLTNCIDVLL